MGSILLLLQPVGSTLVVNRQHDQVDTGGTRFTLFTYTRGEYWPVLKKPRRFCCRETRDYCAARTPSSQWGLGASPASAAQRSSVVWSPWSVRTNKHKQKIKSRPEIQGLPELLAPITTGKEISVESSRKSTPSFKFSTPTIVQLFFIPFFFKICAKIINTP